MEVEYSIDTLGYLVVWLFGELYRMFTKLLVIVSVYRRATLPKTIRPWLTFFILEGQPFRSGPASEKYWVTWRRARDAFRKNYAVRDPICFMELVSCVD